jgi:CDP-diacylglycerol---serine O-phosphatidyltransferase
MEPMAMRGWDRVTRNIAAVLVFGRPPLVFGAFACALWVMFTHDPPGYILGISLLLLALAFDWVDGWFAVRFIPNSRLGPLADRMLDRIVLSIIFPVLAAGMFWRVDRVNDIAPDPADHLPLLHAIFVLAICVLLLVRDQFASFLRSFEAPGGAEPEVESVPLTRLRSLLGLPLAVALYAYAFYLPTEGWERFYRALDWIDGLPLRVWFVVEIVFLVLNITSITLYLRRQGPIALDDISGGDELLRRRILAVIPNVLTLMNGALGITAIVFADHGRVREALFILMGAALFDRLDGLAARRLGLTTPLPNQVKKGVQTGALLDDISDGISFCIAPAWIFYIVMGQVNGGESWWIALTAFVYLAAGIARLIYFTLDKTPVPGFFKGMPVPAAALFVMGPVEIAFQITRANPDLAQPMTLFAAAALLIAALAMNLYPVRYLHIGRLMSRRPILLWVSLAGWLGLVFTPYFGWAVLATTLVYLLSPVFTRQIDPAHAVMEQRVTR